MMLMFGYPITPDAQAYLQQQMALQAQAREMTAYNAAQSAASNQYNPFSLQNFFRPYVPAGWSDWFAHGDQLH